MRGQAGWEGRDHGWIHIAGHDDCRPGDPSASSQARIDWLREQYVAEPHIPTFPSRRVDGRAEMQASGSPPLDPNDRCVRTQRRTEHTESFTMSDDRPAASAPTDPPTPANQSRDAAAAGPDLTCPGNTRAARSGEPLDRMGVFVWSGSPMGPVREYGLVDLLPHGSSRFLAHRSPVDPQC